MSMPWDNPPPQQRTQPPPPTYSPPAPQPYRPPPPPPPVYEPPPPPRQAEEMRPDAAPRRPQHNDLQTMIQNAINEAIVANKDHIQANAQRALVKTVQGKKPTLQHGQRKKDDNDQEGLLSEIAGDIEDAWEGGPVTTRTFVQGMVVDIGFAMMAVLGTVMTPGFDVFDKEAWTVVGVLVLKTIIQTGMSYAMKLKVD